MSIENPLWHPFADMGAVDGHRFVLTRGEGVWVYDSDGNRYFDATAALWYANLGHGRPEIADAVERQLRTLDAYSIFADFANEPALELAALELAADVLREVRKAKSQAKRPMRAPVARVLVHDTPARLAALELGAEDLREAGSVALLETAEAEEFSVEVELAEEPPGQT